MVKQSARMEKIALRFYDDCLKGKRHVLERCEDRNQLTQELYRWKDTERQNNNDIRGTSPSSIISALRSIRKIELMSEGAILVWNELSSLQIRKGRKNTKTREERVREAAQRVREKRGELEKDRNDVTVDHVTFGIDEDDVARPQTKIVQEIVISNNSSDTIHLDVKDEIAKRRGFVVTSEPDHVAIPSRTKHSVYVEYTPRMVGIVNTIVSFNFECQSSSSAFAIVRYISVRSGDPDDNAILKPTAKYQRKKIRDNGEFNRPIRMKKNNTNKKRFPFPLLFYDMPPNLRKMIMDGEGSIQTFLTNILYKGQPPPDDLPSDLSPEFSLTNYSKYFRTLLYIEEFQMANDIKSYDLEGAKLERRGKFYSLLVPGLAESRPSVLRGDIIKIICPTREAKCFAGVVETIECEKAILQFPSAFNQVFMDGMGFKVRFSFSRTTLRVCHQAVSKANTDNILLGRQLFPPISNGSTSLISPLNRATRISCNNRDLNSEQQAAVIGILEACARPLPYLIFGPPGTGKTVTLVEAIVQTAKFDPNARILVCAPSNTATDLIVERLAPYFGRTEMLRLLAFTRDKKTVSEIVMGYSFFDEYQNAFTTPAQAIVKKMRIVAVTIASGGKLPNEGMSGHFSHIFMDEAGHAIEPLALSCFADTIKKDPVIVLAGDPKQLGPIIRSQIAKDFGLEKSLLERLCGCDPYQRRSNGSYDGNVMTKLVRNYRSHEAILKLPNERFYDGDLKCCADVMKKNSLMNWEHLPTKKFPLIFEGVAGRDEREGNSPSWFNREEAQKVKEYVGLLVNGTRSNRVQPEDIAVITPYHRQAQKIRMLLRSHNYGEIKVGSVDEFQGSERRVVIISTVRSSVEYMDFDARHQLGFVANEKRFNVAITRAQALLIVIGNPRILEHDKNWSAFVQHCVENGGYRGEPYTFGGNKDSKFDAEIDDAISGIAGMGLESDKDVVSDEDYVIVSNTTAQEGPAWKMEE